MSGVAGAGGSACAPLRLDETPPRRDLEAPVRSICASVVRPRGPSHAEVEAAGSVGTYDVVSALELADVGIRLPLLPRVKTEAGKANRRGALVS